MIRIMFKEWRDAAPLAALYLLACLVAGRLLAPGLPALHAARGAVASLLALGFIALAAARPFAGERALGTLEFTASLPVGRTRLFAAKGLAALSVCLLGVVAIAVCFGIEPYDVALSRPVAFLPDALATEPLIHAASALLLFAATLLATVAGIGEFPALALGGLVWGLFASLTAGLRTGAYNPILAHLLPALGLLASAWHLFARGEPFDGSRRARDLGRALLLLPATVVALHLIALAASPPATESDLAARMFHGRADKAGERTGPFAALEHDGSCILRTRVPWWDPFHGARGIVRRKAWVDLASGEVRLVPSQAAIRVTPAPDRKLCAWIEASSSLDPVPGRLVLFDAPRGPARPVDFSAAPGFRADQVVDLEWRPDGSRLLATDAGARIALVDPVAGRATGGFRETRFQLRRYVWGDGPDSLAIAEYRFRNERSPAVRNILAAGFARGDNRTSIAPVVVELCRFRIPRDGTLEDPFAALGNAGGTVESFAVAGAWLLALERGPAGRRLHARKIDGGEIRVHPVPDDFTRPLSTGWVPPLLRYDPAGVLEGISAAVDAARGHRPRGILRWRLELASGSLRETILGTDGEFGVVHDTASRARLIGIIQGGDRSRETDPSRWYRFDPETFALAPANFVAEEHRTSVTWWPDWIRNAVISGETAMFLDDPAGMLRTCALPPPGVTFANEERKILLPCPHCGR